FFPVFGIVRRVSSALISLFIFSNNQQSEILRRFLTIDVVLVCYMILLTII
ncbi:hypothetical protein C1646_715536, partial [Rhizophagus diaphanus]